MGGFFKAALLGLAVAGVFRPVTAVAGADAWPIKDFDVSKIGTFTSNLTVRLESIDSVARYYYYVDYPVDLFNLEDFGSVSSDVSDKESMETHLNFSAILMEEYGFPSPSLDRVVQQPDGTSAYRIYLTDNFIVNGVRVGGAFERAACWGGGTGLGAIVLDSDSIYSGEQVSNFGLEALTHELVHAVQYNTSLFRVYCSKTPTDWLTEATAQELGLAIADSAVGGLAGKTAIERYGVRDYTVPLHRPIASEAYQTSSFWRFLAEYYAFVVDGRPTPSAEPGAVNYGYLVSIFEQASASLSDDRASRPESELRIVDQWLQRSYGGKGLRNLFTHFAAVLPYYPAFRRFNGISEDTWLQRTLAGCTEIEFARGDQTYEELITMQPVSAACWRVRANGIDEGTVPVVAEIFSGDKTQLEQLAAGSSAGPDFRDQIFAAENRPLAARPVSLQTKSVVNENPSDGDYVANFQFPFETSRQGSFVLTNVAKNAADTVDLELSTVVFTALYEFASIGSWNVDRGSITDAINTPLEIELTNYNASIGPGIFEQVGDRFIGVNQSEGIENPCLLTVRAYNDRQPGVFVNNTMGIFLQVSGPITPGEYTIAPYRKNAGTTGDILRPGEAEGGASLASMPQILKGFTWETGKLVIKSISPYLVVGQISGVANSRELSDQTDDYEIVATQNLSAKFSIRPTGISTRSPNLPYPCIGSRDLN